MATTTPANPAIVTKAGGLLVQVGTPGIPADTAGRIIRTAVRDHLPGRWRIAELDLAGRLFALTSETRSGELPLTKAWELARTLDALSDLDYAEALFSVYGEWRPIINSSVVPEPEGE